MTAAAVRKGEKSRTDDADKGRGQGKRGAEAELKDDAGAAGALHVPGKREAAVEAMHLDNPMEQIGELVEVDVPAKGAEVAVSLDPLEFLDLSVKTPKGGGG